MLTEVLIMTGLGSLGASFVLNLIFNFIASKTGRNTVSFVNFGTVIRVGFLFWVVTLVIYGLQKLGL